MKTIRLINISREGNVFYPQGPILNDKSFRRNWSTSVIRRGLLSASGVKKFFTFLNERRKEARKVKRVYGVQRILSLAKAKDLAPKVFGYQNAVGIEIECGSSTPLTEEQLPFWVRATSDGSLRFGNGISPVEFRILTPRTSLESRLKTFCDLLEGHNYQVNISCGLHVHLDARHSTP